MPQYQNKCHSIRTNAIVLEQMPQYQNKCHSIRTNAKVSEQMPQYLLNIDLTRPLYVYFRPFLNITTNIEQYLTIKAQMVCLGFEPGTAEWKAQMNPISYGGPLVPQYLPISLRRNETLKSFLKWAIPGLFFFIFVFS